MRSKRAVISSAVAVAAAGTCGGLDDWAEEGKGPDPAVHPAACTAGGAGGAAKGAVASDAAVAGVAAVLGVAGRSSSIASSTTKPNASIQASSSLCSSQLSVRPLRTNEKGCSRVEARAISHAASSSNTADAAMGGEPSKRGASTKHRSMRPESSSQSRSKLRKMGVWGVVSEGSGRDTVCEREREREKV